MARNLILVGSLLLVLVLAFLTISVVIQGGIDVLVVLALVLLAVLGFGVVGALSSAPPDD
jgi:hypothetical protein